MMVWIWPKITCFNVENAWWLSVLDPWELSIQTLLSEAEWSFCCKHAVQPHFPTKHIIIMSCLSETEPNWCRLLYRKWRESKAICVFPPKTRNLRQGLWLRKCLRRVRDYAKPLSMSLTNGSSCMLLCYLFLAIQLFWNQSKKSRPDPLYWMSLYCFEQYCVQKPWIRQIKHDFILIT